MQLVLSRTLQNTIRTAALLHLKAGSWVRQASEQGCKIGAIDDIRQARGNIHAPGNSYYSRLVLFPALPKQLAPGFVKRPNQTARERYDIRQARGNTLAVLWLRPHPAVGNTEFVPVPKFGWLRV